MSPGHDRLDLAEVTLGPLATRVEFHHGCIDTATMHFVALDDRSMRARRFAAG